jgi:hypothetical protein
MAVRALYVFHALALKNVLYVLDKPTNTQFNHILFFTNINKMYDNTKWFYHTFVYNYFTLIVFLLYNTLMMVIEMIEKHVAEE